MNLLKNGRGTLLVYAGLAVITLAVYWPVRHFEFVNYDDDLNVSENRHVQQGLTVGGVAWAFTTTAVDYWRPLTWLTHMLDWQLYGPNAGGHHLTNLFLHVVNTLLLFAVWKRMTGRLWPSALLAGLFALHPLHVGSVAWVTERKDVLSGLFWMLALWAYARYVEQKCLKRYLPLLLFFALGLMAKPMILTLPFVLLLLDVWPLKRMEQGGGRLSELILEKIPLLLLALTSTVVSFVNLHRTGQLVDAQACPLASRIANALVSYVRYLGKALWPVRLSVHYPLPDRWPFWAVVGAALLLLMVSMVVFRERQRRPYLLVGWLWYLGTLLPVIGLIQGQDRAAMADRYTYLPLIGVFIMVVWSIPLGAVEAPARKMAATAAAAVLLGMCAALSCFQVRYWRDSVTLFRRALEVTTDNELAHYNLGCALLGSGDVHEAAVQLEHALHIDPGSAAAHNNLGLALIRQGKVQEAVGHWKQALRIKPDYAEAYTNLGNVLLEQGEVPEAAAHYEQALRAKPDYAEAHNNLAAALIRQGKVKEAILHLEQALRINPDYSEAQSNLARVRSLR